MSDPQPTPGKRTPPRAEPLQPDKPGSGTATDNEKQDGGAARQTSSDSDSVAKQKKQSDAALDNVREGYD
jgi:hypothetical protein